ncbi:hypothetical protein QTP70_035042 [Hemibagrus guttatus]|uniref:Transmembrane protein 163 n=1 Tax=Hemibagrus guttatus TaxID=175788 RepID=A0AAE0R663_9TELE|nr:hypothetical protein QTP70_035042 [Hemibagrus guttatus]
MADFSAPCPVPESVVVVDPAAGSGTERDREMNITDSVEGEGLLESSMRLKPHEAQSYRKKALWVSWISIVVTLILAVAAFNIYVYIHWDMQKEVFHCAVITNINFFSNLSKSSSSVGSDHTGQPSLPTCITVSFMRHSASAFGFAFDATLDVLTSVIVLWRYSNAAAVHSAHREYIACVILGVIFILSSMCILGKAIHDLSTKLLPEVDDFLFSVSIVSGILCIILAIVKFMLGRVLTSRALITDGFNSLVGGIMGFSILISAEVFRHEPTVWFLDGTIGVLIGLIILAYGIK